MRILAAMLATVVLGACAVTPSPPPPPEISPFASFEACNIPNHFIRHRNFEFEISDDASVLGRNDETFRIVDGLADSRAISFESLNYPGHYLRHQGSFVVLEPYENTDAFKGDATFVEQASNASALAGDSYACDLGKISYQAWNRPGWFLRHRHFRLELGEFYGYEDGSWFSDPDAGRQFRESSSFRRAEPRADTSFVDTARSLASVNYPLRYVRHRNFLGELTRLESTLDRKDATFRVVTGLATPEAEGGPYVSFESINYPGFYLRHTGPGTRIVLQEYNGNPVFRRQATFVEMRGLSERFAGRSYEAYEDGAEGHFIRHRNFLLWLESGEGELFRDDATFQELDPLFWTSP